MSPLDIFWNDAKQTIFCTQDEYVAAMRDVEFRTWGDDGAMAIVGNEVHVVGVRRGWITRRAIREGFIPLLRERGVLTTRVARSNIKSCRFVERMGFKKCGEDQLDNIYRIERSNYE
jgi:hypothetical protein